MMKQTKPHKAAKRRRKADNQPSIEEIAGAVSSLCERHDRPQAYIARQLGVRDRTFNAWLNGTIVCRHRKMLMLALDALAARMI